MGSVKRKSPEEEPSTHSSEKQLQHDSVHHVSYPPGYNNLHSSSSSSSSLHTEPAKKFPFALDPFQSQSITCLENGESVMVSFFFFKFLNFFFIMCHE